MSLEPVATASAAEPSVGGGAGAGDDKGKKAAADINLTSFAVYRVHGKAGDPDMKVEILAGATDSRVDAKGRVQLLAGSVPFHSPAFKKRTPAPGAGLLALYGNRDALEELAFWRAYAREQKAEFAYVTYNVVVGTINPLLVDRARLRADRSIGFLNIRRTMSSLQSDIHERFKGYVKEERGNADVNMAKPSQIATRPDLFDRLFDDDKDLRQLSVFVIPVADNPDVPGKMRQLAYVRPGSTVIDVRQGVETVDLLLPTWVTDEKAAKKLRKGA